MSTSGTTAYSVNERKIVEVAAGHLNVRQVGQAMEADEYTVFRDLLNMLVKQWVAQVDFAPGLKMWTRRRGYLFLQSGQVSYALGPSGDECAAESYVGTMLTAAASGSALTVASASGIVSGYRIGIRLDTGAMHWTVVNGSPSGMTVNLTTGLPSTASSGAQVFCYQSKVQRPFDILSASRRTLDGDDIPMDPNLSLGEYELISRKTSISSPSRMYFEAQRTNARVYLDCAPVDVTDVVRIVYQSYIEDMTAATDDVDFPAEWYRPLAAQLALDAAPTFGKPVTVELKLMRDESLKMAQNAYPAKSLAYFESEPDDY